MANPTGRTYHLGQQHPLRQSGPFSVAYRGQSGRTGVRESTQREARRLAAAGTGAGLQATLTDLVEHFPLPMVLFGVAVGMMAGLLLPGGRRG
jgi:hypothetical protein